MYLIVTRVNLYSTGRLFKSHSKTSEIVIKHNCACKIKITPNCIHQKTLIYSPLLFQRIMNSARQEKMLFKSGKCLL